MIARFKQGILAAAFLGALLVVAGNATPAAAQAVQQAGPWVFIGADGRVTTYDFTCHGDQYAYEHVMIFTSAGRRVISFTQTCSSKVGVVQTLGNLAAFIPLLDSDGLIEGIEVIGYHRRASTTKTIDHYLKSTSGDFLDDTMHAANDPLQYDDSKEPMGTTTVGVYSSPPVP